jgi:hypothetical protein
VKATEACGALFSKYIPGSTAGRVPRLHGFALSIERIPIPVAVRMKKAG